MPTVANRSVTKTWLRAIELTSRIEAAPTRLFSDAVEEWSLQNPDRPALISESETFSYRMLSERINRYARWALASGIEPGDTVGLLMPTRPEYLAAWLGISKVGGVVALINTKLVGTSLSHAINLARARHLIVTADFAAILKTAMPHLDPVPQLWFHGGDGSEARIDAALDLMDGSPLASHERRGIVIDDPALLIYTSGTTGLPKAARISHRRILNWGFWFAGLTNAAPDDRLYDCLPVHHSVGGIVAPCSMLAAGASAVLAGKFSVRDFWRDVVRWDCTMFQYIGELCRFLLRAPPSAFESKHRLRLACGNGLRGDIWQAFQARFALSAILEFYAATEGNFSLFNVEGKPGSIGRIPSFLAHRFPVAIVRFDVEHGVPLRSADGLCIPCARGETGEALGRIGTASEGGGRFEGYTDAAETEQKILRDVLVPGDRWFRTGDLMMTDEAGYFHFVDRIGDTFRWKGENVAASEVAAAIAGCTGVIDVGVYGVTVGGTDGRAGMAAIVIDDERFDLVNLEHHLAGRLPAYAHPVFLRICPALRITDTFKQNKQELIRQGFDPDRVDGALFYRDAATGGYGEIDADAYAGIISGVIRL
jgi:fatty-acyl-CoA synthase